MLRNKINKILGKFLIVLFFAFIIFATATITAKAACTSCVSEGQSCGSLIITCDKKSNPKHNTIVACGTCSASQACVSNVCKSIVVPTTTTNKPLVTTTQPLVTTTRPLVTTTNTLKTTTNTLQITSTPLTTTSSILNTVSNFISTAVTSLVTAVTSLVTNTVALITNTVSLIANTTPLVTTTTVTTIPRFTTPVPLVTTTRPITVSTTSLLRNTATTIMSTTTTIKSNNGACGSAKRTYNSSETGYGDYTFCDSGVPNPCLVPFPTVGGSISWQCLGADDRNRTDDAECVAYRSSAEAGNVSVNGKCGSAAGNFGLTDTEWGSRTFCETGTASTESPFFPTAGNMTSWQCLGSGNGNNVSCSAKKAAVSSVTTTTIHVVSPGTCEATATLSTSGPINLGDSVGVKCEVLGGDGAQSCQFFDNNAWKYSNSDEDSDWGTFIPQTPDTTGLHTYECTCISNDECSDSKTIQVNAVNTPTLTFSSNPKIINSNASSTLSWKVFNATSCWAQSSPADPNWSGNKSFSNGSWGQVITPPATPGINTYSLECWNDNGNTTGKKSDTVKVIFVPTTTTNTTTTTSTSTTRHWPTWFEATI